MAWVVESALMVRGQGSEFRVEVELPVNSCPIAGCLTSAKAAFRWRFKVAAMAWVMESALTGELTLAPCQADHEGVPGIIAVDWGESSTQARHPSKNWPCCTRAAQDEPQRMSLLLEAGAVLQAVHRASGSTGPHPGTTQRHSKSLCASSGRFKLSRPPSA